MKRALFVSGLAASLAAWPCRAALSPSATPFLGAESKAVRSPVWQRPSAWLVALGAVAGAGEFLADRKTEAARRTHLSNPTDENFDAAKRWESRRNLFAYVWIPALTVGVSWTAFDAWKGRKGTLESAPTLPPTHGAPAVPSAPPPAIPPKPPVRTGGAVESMSDADAYYERGRSYYESGNKMAAMLEFTRCLDVKPSYKDAAAWVTKINGELSAARPPAAPATGGAPPVAEAVITERMAKAYDYFTRGEYRKASEEFRLVVQLTGAHGEANKMLVEANSRYQTGLREQLKKAADARAKRDLVAEIVALRTAAKIDEQSEQVRKELVAANAKVPEESQRLYRRGLDLYLANRVEESIAAWKTVLEIEPRHERSLSAIEKAERKLDEMKASQVGR